MGRNRYKDVVEVESSEGSDDAYFDDNDSDNENHRHNYHGSNYQFPYVGDEDKIKRDAYKQVMKEYAELKIIKRKLAMSLSCEASKQQCLKIPNVTSTSFSVSTFGSVIDSLTPAYRKVIEDFGFGSLLMFDKCIVPSKFVKWVASLVIYRSGDVVIDGKVISLTKQSVNLVLGLPISDKPFPVNYAVGKSIVLSRFGKHSIPSVSYFADKLVKKESMPDEDVLICFLLVALNSFLCSNSNLVPSYKYFGIFEDLVNAKDLDWCGYILNWLLEGIKAFNHGKTVTHSDGATPSGCLFYLAVIYLDHVDFGSRQVPDSIPRISVWKGNMLREYADYDLKYPGCYGYHPLMDISRTCYSKLDSFAGRPLSSTMKTKICTLIQCQCFNCGVSVNLDVSSVSVLPDDMKVIFCKLMKHAYSIDSRCQQLALDLIKILAEDVQDKEQGDMPFSQPPLSEPNEPRQLKENTTTMDNLNCDNSNDGAHAHYSQFDINAVHRSSPTLKSNIAHEDCSQSDTFDSSNDDSHRIIHLPVPNLPQSASIRSDSEAQTSGAARLLEKVSNNSITPPIQKTHTRFVPPPSGYAPNHHVHHLLYEKSNCSQTEKIQPLQQPGSIPLGDSTNTLSSKKRKKSVSFITKEDHLKDVILLDDEPCYYVPDSISPSPKPGYTRYYSQKENVSPGTSQQTPIHAQDLDLSPQISARTNLIASRPRSGPSAKAKSQAQHSLVNSQHKVCPEVEILAKTTLADNVRIMTQKCDEIYNSKLKRSGHSDDTPKDVIPSNLSSCHFAIHTQPFRIRESTTGGQSPVHGPRRVIKPAPLFNDDYATAPKGFHVSKSQVDNYSIICKLARSRYHEDAVNLSGVRCTFWALGDSLKPEGLVKSFVISAFCYSLFQRRNGHPDSSKRHYFFPNIVDNLLKDIDDADEDVLARAFGRSSKARPLSRSNMLFFPTCVADHWFLFVVDITDRKYVILDSVHNKDSEFQEVVRERLRNSFQFHWKKFIKLDMGFPHYEFSYPHVPQQPSDNNSDSGIYVMVFIEHWLSSRTVLTSLFTHEDIPNIRIKIANDLVFQPKNTGMIHRISEFKDESSTSICFQNIQDFFHHTTGFLSPHNRI
ncbi:unnamed protein product [Urochloa decumbens]|uniref:Ubiquitin-like protease family profile domain-containing protein n=1 Tax=Urochloa decumbens TaxID=240449 RepID=A0ABC8XNL9_9POAL